MINKLPVNGWLNLNKPLGITSARAVAVVKRQLHPNKIGHAGTLDPLASGVLPLALGEATKTMQFCMDLDKEYEFTVKWGELTATLDAEGEVIERSHVRPTKQQILDVLPKFTGEINQTPPLYSAIKINGQRAYDLARKGAMIEMKARKVMVYKLELLSSDFCTADSFDCLPPNVNQSLAFSTFRARCGKGTYIRSLARDIALALGTLAHITILTRTRVGNFSINDAILLENIDKTVYKEEVSRILLPLDSVLDDIQVLEFTAEYSDRIRNGQKILIQNFPQYCIAADGVFIAKCGGVAVAICELGDGIIKPLRVFNL